MSFKIVVVVCCNALISKIIYGEVAYNIIVLIVIDIVRYVNMIFIT